MKNKLMRLLDDYHPVVHNVRCFNSRIDMHLAAEWFHRTMEDDDRLVGFSFILKDQIHHKEEDGVVAGSVYYDLGRKGEFTLCDSGFKTLLNYKRVGINLMFVAKAGKYQIHSRRSLQGLVISPKMMESYLSDQMPIWEDDVWQISK